MILYRAIAIEPPLNLDKLGVYWCSEKAKAYCYGVKKYMPFYYIYKAEIEDKYINVTKTKEVNERWPHEKEVRIYPDSPVKVLEITKHIMTLETQVETINLQFNAKT